MADYESLKVAELKSLLKERGVSATGLTKKAQYIQALQHDDIAKAQDTTNGAGIAQEAVDQEEVAVDATAQVDSEQVTAETAGNENNKEITSEKLDDVAEADVETAHKHENDGVTESKLDAEDTPQDRKRKREDVVEDDATPEEKKPRQDLEEQNNTSSSRDGPEDIAQDKLRSTPLEQENQSLEKSDDRPADKPLDEEMKDVDMQQTSNSTRNDGPPSEHRATNSLYISRLMRPLQAQSFREHLESLIDDKIERLHLDFMKTHAFVVCRNRTDASTIRSRLHNHIWPEETQRRPLWVDFVPENEVVQWIEEETNAGREARFSVSYIDGVARLENASSGDDSQRQPPRSNNEAGRGVPGAPLGPRGDRRAPQQRPVHDDRPPRAQQSASFNKLDQYFKFTTARPKIYYQPVTKEIADRRLDELDRETSRDWDRGRAWNRSEKLAPIDQLRRYTFEDERVVDGGLDFGGFGRRQGAGGSGGVNPHSQRGGGSFRGRYRGGDRRY